MIIDSILICGSRGFGDYAKLKDSLSFLIDVEDPVTPPTTIIVGGSRGADALGERFAKEYNIPFKVCPANWEKHGKKAGFVRNKQMINLNPDIVIAFWDGKSKGTRHTIGLAKEKKIMTIIVYV